MPTLQASSAGARAYRPATPIALAGMLASGVLVAALGSRLSFLLDDWNFILNRRSFDADAFLAPDNEHLVAGPVAVWKLVIAAFGIDSTLPFYLVSAAIFLLGVWFLFVWTRRRIGEWPALLAILPVLFLGAASDDFLWLSASIFFVTGMTCGLGMLLSLDRRDRIGDRLACCWLVATMLFSSLWLAFAAGAAADVFLRRREREWRRRVYVVLVPLALYAIWWLGWGHEGGSSLSLENAARMPRYALDGFSAALAALFGLATPVEGVTSPAGLEWGRPLAVLLGALAVWRLYRIGRLRTSLWVAIAIAVAFWALGGLAVKPGRTPWETRYLYAGVAVVLLVAAELLRGVSLTRRLLAPVLIVVAAAVASNVLFLKLAYDSYRSTSEIERADLAAVEIARETVEPDFVLDEDIADTSYVHVEAGPYLSARDAYGSPAFSVEELRESPGAARFAADKVLASALRIGLFPLPPGSRPAAGAPIAKPNRAGAIDVAAGGCRAVPGGANPPLLLLPRGGLTVYAGREPVTDIRIGRFADDPSVDFGHGVESGHAIEIRVPTDGSTVPWKARLEGGLATVCGPQAD